MESNAMLIRLQQRLDSIWNSGAITSAHLQQGKPVIVRTNGNTQYLADSTEITAEEISALADHIGWPANKEGSFDSEGRWRAQVRLYSATAAGQAGGGLKGGGTSAPVLVQIRFLPHTPRDIGEYRFPPSLRESLCSKGTTGIVLIGGQPLSGRTTTADAFVVAAARARGASGVSVLTLEKPVEYVLTENMVTGMTTIPSTVLQVEPGKNVENWVAAADLAVRGDWDIVFVGATHPGGPRSEFVTTAIPEIARSGKLVITTTVGTSFTECFLRACSSAEPNQERLNGKRMAQQLRAIIVQEIIRGRGPDGKASAVFNAMVLHLRQEDRELLSRQFDHHVPDRDALRRVFEQFLVSSNPASVSPLEARQKLPRHFQTLSSLSE